MEKLGHGEADTGTPKLPRNLFAEVFYPLQARGSWCSSAESHHSGSNTSQKAFIALKAHKSTFSTGCARLCDLKSFSFQGKPTVCVWCGWAATAQGSGCPWSHLCPIWCWHCKFQSSETLGLRADTARDTLSAEMGILHRSFRTDSWFRAVTDWSFQAQNAHPSSFQGPCPCHWNYSYKQ